MGEMINKMEDNKRPFEICECGWKVKGTSQLHAEANLKIHKDSKLHRKLMDLQESEEEVLGGI